MTLDFRKNRINILSSASDERHSAGTRVNPPLGEAWPFCHHADRNLIKITATLTVPASVRGIQSRNNFNRGLGPLSPWMATRSSLQGKVKDELHKKVCAGQITLIEAQQIISRDWTKAK